MRQFSLLLAASFLLLLAFVAGCPPTDSDGDGWNDDEDCEPDNPDVHPGATEAPGNDGVDSDCDGNDAPTGDDDDDDDGRTDPGIFDSAEAVTGDFSCVGNLPAILPGAPGALNGLVEDFQEDDPVPGARVRIWLDNDPTGATPDGEFTTEADGTFSMDEVTSCSPFAARVWTEFEPPETYQTFQVDIVVAGTPPYSETFNSVAYSTYQLLPLTVGVEPEPGKGIAAGRFRDCNGDPIANAEASVGTLDLDTGAVVEAEDYAMRYFENEDPEQAQLWISEDGLFGGMNVPPGASWNLLIWGIAQDEAHCLTTTGGDVIGTAANEAYCLLGYSTLAVQPDSVNIANVDLKPYPDACYDDGGDDDDSAGDDDDDDSADDDDDDSADDDDDDDDSGDDDDDSAE